MRLVYREQEIGVTRTNNERIMRYKVQKLYFAYYILNCNRYSSIVSKQCVDVVMVDNDNRIIDFILGMRPNTVFENEKAVHTILFPVGQFKDFEIGEIISYVE